MSSKLRELRQRLTRLQRKALMTDVSPDAHKVRIRALVTALGGALLDAESSALAQTEPKFGELLALGAKINLASRTLLDPAQRSEADRLSRRLEALIRT